MPELSPSDVPDPGFHCPRCWHLWREGDHRWPRLGCPYCNPVGYKK